MYNLTLNKGLRLAFCQLWLCLSLLDLELWQLWSCQFTLNQELCKLLSTFATSVMLTSTGISVCCQLWLCLSTLNLELGQLWLHLSSLDLELLATLVVLFWAKLHFCQLQLRLSWVLPMFWLCLSKRHLNLMDLVKIQVRFYKFELFQMCT